MLDIHADGLTKSVKKHLPDNEEENTESDVPQRPAVLESAHDKYNLHHQIDRNTDRIEDIEDHEEGNSVRRTKPTPSLKGQEGDYKGDGEHGHGAPPQQPN